MAAQLAASQEGLGSVSKCIGIKFLSHRRHCLPNTEPSWLKLFRHISGLCSENQAKHVGAHCVQKCRIFVMLKQVVHMVITVLRRVKVLNINSTTRLCM
jgi:hypothetical protein